MIKTKIKRLMASLFEKKPNSYIDRLRKVRHKQMPILYQKAKLNLGADQSTALQGPRRYTYHCGYLKAPKAY